MNQGDLEKKIFEQYLGKNVEVILRADIPGFSGKVTGKVKQCNENFIFVGDALLAYPMIWGLKPINEEPVNIPVPAPVSVPEPVKEEIKPEIKTEKIDPKWKDKIFEGELILFHPRRKFGAILSHELDAYNIPSVKDGQIFVHANQISDEDLKQKLLTEYDKRNNHKPMLKVTFKISENEKGSCADDVREKLEAKVEEPKEVEEVSEPEEEIIEVQKEPEKIEEAVEVKFETEIEEPEEPKTDSDDFGISLGSILGLSDWEDEERFLRKKQKPKSKSKQKFKPEPEEKPKSKSKPKLETKQIQQPIQVQQPEQKEKKEKKPDVKPEIDYEKIPDSELTIEKVPPKKLDWQQQRFEGDLIFFNHYRNFGFIFCPQLEKYGVVEEDQEQKIFFHVSRVTDKLLKSKLISEKIFEPMIKVFFKIRRSNEGDFFADEIQAKYKKTDDLLTIKRPEFAYDTAAIQSVNRFKRKLEGKIKIGRKFYQFYERDIIDPLLLVFMEYSPSVEGQTVKFTKIQRPNGLLEIKNVEAAEPFPENKVKEWEKAGLIQKAKERLNLEI